MKNPKYLVRPDDYMIFEIDETNGCYRCYESKPKENRSTAYKHFSYENLTENYGFFPIKKKQIPEYEKLHNFEIGYMCWSRRNDGHGGCKGGTKGEYLEYLERVKRYSAIKTK